MNILKSLLPREMSLKDFVLSDSRNRAYFIISLSIILLQLLIYKYYYPFASFIYGDSYCYIDEAIKNAQIDTYPIGYPMFLRLFSAITCSDTALVIFQYLLLQIGGLFLVFTLFYFYRLHELTKIILLGVTLFNPFFLHLANTVSSDNFFFSVSLIWFTLLIWLLYKPTFQILVIHAIVMFLAFIIRFNALCYPLIILLVFLQSNMKALWKLVGIALVILLVGSFINYNREKYAELCGIKQFSPFSGWLMANNAMYAYRYIPVNERKGVPDKFRKLDQNIRQYFDSTKDHRKYPIEGVMAYHDYMWDQRVSPLWSYFREEYKQDVDTSIQKTWARLGPFYKEYGTWIIVNYPIEFSNYVLWPNFQRWFAPPIEFLEKYNSGYNNVPNYVKDWFKYKSDKIYSRVKNPKMIETALGFYPMVVGISHILFFFSFLALLFLGINKKYPLLFKGVLLVFFYWIVNLGFSVFASPIALRFQMFPIQVMTYFLFVMLDYIWAELKNDA